MTKEQAQESNSFLILRSGAHQPGRMIQGVFTDLPADLAPRDTGGPPVHAAPHARIDHLIGYFTKALIVTARDSGAIEFKDIRAF